MRKTAVVLFNLGGPDSLEAVRPFLFNLFYDPAILAAPKPVRWLLAKLISARRAPVAREIYEQLGGASPLLQNTWAQGEALEGELNRRWAGKDHQARTFVAMRYWQPRAEAAARDVHAYGPDEVVLLPLYPQFSTTTTGSSFEDWKRAARAAGLAAPTRALCCYPDEPGFVGEAAAAIEPALAEATAVGTPRLLFSAHGLPKKVVESGDPYQWQVERTAAAIAGAVRARRPGATPLDWTVCYQSRVGPLEWIGPYTDDEIRRAGRDRAPLVVAPIAFVSEHSETLVELDVEYRRLAEESGVPLYRRVPTVGAGASFIGGLADLVAAALDGHAELCSGAGGRICPAEALRCAQAGR